MRTSLIIAAALFASGAAQAALPPTAESLRRVQAITTSPDVYKALGSSRWVSSIVEDEEGKYTVTAGECALEVEVAPILSVPPAMVPPLKVTVGRMTCLP